MAKDAFDRWWEWVEKPADSPLTIPAMMPRCDYHQESGSTGPVNEAVRLADPNAHR
jgi:hypothetical protein